MTINRHRGRHRDRKVETNRKSPLFDDANYVRTYSSKNAYENEWRAKFTVDEMKSRYGVDLDVYLCPYCGKYHLTEK